MPIILSKCQQKKKGYRYQMLTTLILMLDFQAISLSWIDRHRICNYYFDGLIQGQATVMNMKVF